ncbi:MAG: DUF4143 domain-containing protein [Chitinispirillia bacterium]|nr:DUF4143 domain-containing protein [Chitinispirillia bacterium]MCL2242117.1 DUF4143 domain-containing protein [Chitinispirillia bacterium]
MHPRPKNAPNDPKNSVFDRFLFNKRRKFPETRFYTDPPAHIGKICRVSRVPKPAVPLKRCACTTGAFKLFMADVGLMSAMAGLDVRTLLKGDALFTGFRGALTEQFVCQELQLINDIEIAYWANENPARAEIGFIVQAGKRIIPIEVKSTTNLKAKSFSVYREKFRPALEIRTSQTDYKQTNNLLDIPLYAIGGIGETIFR